MKKLNLVVIVSIFLLTILSVSLVSGHAVCAAEATKKMTASNVTIYFNMTAAASGSILKGSGGHAVINVTYDKCYENQSWNGSLVYMYSTAATANSTKTLSLGTLVNKSTGNYPKQVELNGTINTTILEDGADYTLICELRNKTAGGGASKQGKLNVTLTNIVIDNTEPVQPSSLSPSTDSIDDDATINFSVTVTGNHTTNCTLYFPDINPGSASYTMTHSKSNVSNSCSKQFTSLPDQMYKWFVQASDGSNRTNSSTYRALVQASTGAGRATLAKQERTRQQQRSRVFSIVEARILGIPLWVIVAFVVLVGVIIIAVKRRKS